MEGSIAIVDYGMGNVASVKNMLNRIEVKHVLLASTPEAILKSDKIILPGVGAFDHGMNNLKEYNLINALNEKVISQKTPVLGICLGMQLLTESSEEGIEKGLGWVKAKTRKLDFTNNGDLKIPHMGWNYVSVKKKNPLISEDDNFRYYFVHSYYVDCFEQKDILGTTEYGINFSSAIQHENIFGAQFHPEKSHKFGMKLLENFAKL